MLCCRNKAVVHAIADGHYGRGTGPIWLDGSNCTGTETSLFDCSIVDHPYNCSTHFNDVAVECDSKCLLSNIIFH